MIKKLGFMLIIVLVVSSFTACGSDYITGNKDVKDLIENIGLKKEEVFNNLKLEEGKDIEEFDGKAGIYAFKEERTVYGQSLKLALTFDINNDKMYGFMYIKGFKDQKKDAYDLTQKLQKDLNKAYGEPATYPELTNTISKMPNYEDLPEKESADFLETWKADDGLDVELRMTIQEGQNASVTLTYKINTLPEDWNK
ncbi:hypothetical protein [Paenibacillus sp. SAFN-117]|uniref:hypothetical protein n=1 Tax=Paenibacillus sp. SAFN-117 TaxID=3436860 RepID=UPI003F7EDBE6